jgi:hypothetical protein
LFGTNRRTTRLRITELGIEQNITKYFFGFALFRGARLLLDVVFGDFVVS